MPWVIPPPVPPPGFVTIDACSGSLAACENGSTVPCTVHCATRADGCEVFSEFVPIGNVSSSYYFRFGPIDPAGEWALYSRVWGGGRYEYTPYRWSAADGSILLSQALGVPPTPEGHESLVVLKATPSGTAILLARIDPVEAYVWTRDEGLMALDFEPSDMSADGRVVAGLQGYGAVIWDRQRGTRALAGSTVDEPALDAGVPTSSAAVVSLSDTGELALVRGLDGRGFRWSEAQGVVPFETLPGFPAGAQVMAADPNGPVLWASTGGVGPAPQRLWRWTEAEGALALGRLPTLPFDAAYNASMPIANGQAILGTAGTDLRAVAFRWSSDLGMQQLSDSVNSTAFYANPDGTTVVGYVNRDGTVWSSFRWTAQSGASDVPGEVRGGIAFGGDLLLASVGPEPRVLKYDSALQNGGALPIDIIQAGLLPKGYELMLVEAMSDNARLLAGTARDAEGTVHGWLLRLRDNCSP